MYHIYCIPIKLFPVNSLMGYFFLSFYTVNRDNCSSIPSLTTVARAPPTSSSLRLLRSAPDYPLGCVDNVTLT